MNEADTANSYGVSPSIRKIVHNSFYWQNLMCFEIMKKQCGVSQKSPNKIQTYWTICGSNSFDVSAFKNMIREYYILHQFQKTGISHVSFIMDREIKNEKSSIDFKIEKYKWSYDNENAWDDQCKLKNQNGHIRSPIVFDDQLVRSTYDKMSDAAKQKFSVL